MTNPSGLNDIWNRQMALASKKWEDDVFWYERTQLPSIGVKTSDYAEILINRMMLTPNDSVLDIGCGDGAISMRIAKRVKQITALDANPDLLFPISQRADTEGISNLEFVNLNWMESRIGTEINLHDIVLASRFRQITNLQLFLEHMHKAADKRCYMTWIAEREEMDAEICAVSEREYHPLPEYFLIVNMLDSMGLSTHVEIFETNETHKFESKQDAIENAMRGYKVESPDIRAIIAEMAMSGLEHKDGYWWDNTLAKWALIWWEKR